MENKEPTKERTDSAFPRHTVIYMYQHTHPGSTKKLREREAENKAWRNNARETSKH